MNQINTMPMPQILKETHYGVSSHSIADEMFQRREIICTGEINEDTANAVIFQIYQLCQEDPDKDITLYINSPGGEVTSGLAIYDAMRGVPCRVNTVCIGRAASMGAVLFTAGDERKIMSNAYVMIHDPLTQGIGGSALSIRSMSESLMRTRETLCNILAAHTGKTLEEIYEKTKEDTYFYAEDAVKFGLADSMIQPVKAVKEMLPFN